MKFNQLRGYIFEIMVLKLVLSSGYHLIEKIDKKRMNINRDRFLEYKGRGGYHQIDIPVDCDFSPNFIYPIRLLGEVKYHENNVTKQTIRQEIGVMIDIQQNYTDADYNDISQRLNRKTEVFAVFSATGFNVEAEKLAFAHNIKTISFADNKCMIDIKRFSNDLAKLYEDTSTDEQNQMLDSLFDYLILNKVNIYKEDNGKNLLECSKLISNIKTAFIGTTSSGLTLFFCSDNEFNFKTVFSKTDEALCRIYSGNDNQWYLIVNNTDTKLYFSMPKLIYDEVIIKDEHNIYPRKEKIFEAIHFRYKIDEIDRNLSFTFDHEWFKSIIKDD